MATLQIFNDTQKELTLRINIKDSLPSVTKVEPQHIKAVFMQTEEVLIKLWNDNVLLVQDIKKDKVADNCT